MVKNHITSKLNEALKSSGINEPAVLERPNNMTHGDYTTAVALRSAKTLKKSPMEVASSIAKHIVSDNIIEKIDILKPGFINFWINKNIIVSTLSEQLDKSIVFPDVNFGQTKALMIEYAHPNPFKLVHIGHLRNITTGEAMARILASTNNKIIRVNYQGDVGLHIAKCLYRIKQLYESDGPEKFRNLSLNEKIKFLGTSYAEGNNAYEDDPEAKEKIIEINKKIYEKDPQISALWNEGRQWSLDYFHDFYKRVDTKFQREYFESECADRGREISLDAESRGILEKSEGAIVFNGKKYGLDTRVFINSNGFPTYEGKELGLAEKEFSEFGEFDKCLHVVASEQTSFFKVTFKVQSLIDPNKYKDKQYHLVYGFVRLKTGKMSSREGNIIEANWLIDEAKRKLIESFKCDEDTAETLAIAAVKYSFLKHELKNEISFDFDESISLNGNSAIYLIYTYVRCLSVLKNNRADSEKNNPADHRIETEENDLIRQLFHYPDIVAQAAASFSPQIIATFLFEIAQKYNLFYQKHQILKAEPNAKEFRLLLTKSVSKVLINGLNLLGIKAVEKM